MNLDAERERLRSAVANMSPSLGLVFADHQALIDAQASALASKEAEAIERSAQAIERKVVEHARAFPAAEHELARLQFALDGSVFAAAIRALGKGT